jgi:AsmA-like C-terminal region
MPIGKFISGKLSSHISIQGKLNSDMSPDPAGLKGQGNILLVDARMKHFGPMDKLAESLDVPSLRDANLKEVKADFSLKDNAVQVPYFIANFNGMEMDISGSHGFDQSLNYDINLKVPRKDLGAKGRTWVKQIVTQAAYKGIPVQLTDQVNVNVVMAGTINSPVVKANMNEELDNAAADLKTQVDHFVKTKIDSAKDQLREPKAMASHKMIAKTATKKKGKYLAKKGPALARTKAGKVRGKRKPKSAHKYYS